MLHLEEIDQSHQRAYLEAAKEFYDQAQPDADLYYEQARNNFSDVVQLYRDRARGIHLPPGFAQEYKYLLVDDDIIVGRAGIRPNPNEMQLQSHGHIGYTIRPSFRGRGYGTAALRRLIEKARALGIDEPIAVCKPDNLPSLRIITKSGAREIGTVTLPDGTTRKQFILST